MVSTYCTTVIWLTITVSAATATVNQSSIVYKNYLNNNNDEIYLLQFALLRPDQ